MAKIGSVQKRIKKRYTSDKGTILNMPEKQMLILNYVRSKGKQEGMGSVVDLTDRAVKYYIDAHPEFAAQVRLAMDQFVAGEQDDLQVHWNHNAKEYNEAFIGRVLQLLLEGDNSLEVRRRYKPLYLENGEPDLDENGEHKMVLTSVEEKEIQKSTPKYILEMAGELMQNTYGQPELAKIAPVLLLKFVQYIQREGQHIRGEGLKELVGLASHFDDELKKDMVLKTAKPR